MTRSLASAHVLFICFTHNAALDNANLAKASVRNSSTGTFPVCMPQLPLSARDRKRCHSDTMASSGFLYDDPQWHAHQMPRSRDSGCIASASIKLQTTPDDEADEPSGLGMQHGLDVAVDLIH